jgi:hypothetical protein
MNEEKLLSITKKGLFLKSTLLSMAVLGVVLTKPVTGAVQSGAHKICQLSMKTAAQCQPLCYSGKAGVRSHNMG